jgi:hypothetical protein
VVCCAQTEDQVTNASPSDPSFCEYVNVWVTDVMRAVTVS